MLKEKIFRVSVFILLAFSTTAFGQLFQKPVAATPQRPSNSYNTSTTPAGWVEVEFGSAIDSHVFDSPVVLKVGLQRNLELFVGASPLVHVSNGHSESGFGDVNLGFRSRFGGGMQGLPTFGGVVTVKIPTANENKGLGTGNTDWTFMIIVSQSTGHYGLDLNVGFKNTNLPEGQNQSRFVGILTGSTSFTPKLSAYSELFLSQHVRINRTDVGTADVNNVIFVGAAGISYTVSPRFVIDAGLNINITNAPYDFQFLVGATSTLFKLW